MVDNLVQLLSNTVALYPNITAQSYWDGTVWRERTYRELWDAIMALARGLQSQGIKSGDRVGILSHTRPEWVIADFAVLAIGAITVPIYPSVPPDQVSYIVEDAAMDWIFVENRQLGSKVPFGTKVIFFDKAETGSLQWDEIGQPGDPPLPLPWERETVATLVYTSGTTGIPKGVILTHGNILSNIEAIADLGRANPSMAIGPQDVVLSFLPLSHILERMVHAYFLSQGAVLAYAESADRLPQNLKAVRPTLMVAVPRVFEKIYGQVLDEVRASSRVKQFVFRLAVGNGFKWYDALVTGRSLPPYQKFLRQVYQRMVFSQIRSAVGGRLRLVVSGGAPLNPAIGRFFFVAGIPILEGYGLTETSPVVALNLLPLPRYGTAGQPLPNVEVRIAEDGEILTRGPNVSQGYWNRPDDTQEAFQEGWFHTGDMGNMTLDGYLRITDRKKYLLVLSTGKNVAPAAVEQRLVLSPMIDQAVVLGNRRKFVSALLYLEPNQVRRWAEQEKLATFDWDVLLKSPLLMRYMENEVTRVVQDLAAFERPKKIRFLPLPLTEATGELTPSLKVRMPIVETKYHDLIESMYDDEEPGDEPSADSSREGTAWMPRVLLGLVLGVVIVILWRFLVH